MSEATAKSQQAAIVDWVGDIVALEGHVEEALDRQLQLKPSNSKVATAIQHFHDTVKASKDRATAFQKQTGTTPAKGVIKTGMNLLGKAAGMIDQMRDDKASKAIRDDYTAFNHLAIAYTMLHTTAMAYGDETVTRFAEDGLRTYARLVQEVNEVIPDVVLMDLKENSEPVTRPDIADQCRQEIDRIWKSTAQESTFS